MYRFRVTFMNRETQEKKAYVVEARGICQVIEAICAKAMLFGWVGWDIYSVKLITK